MKKDFSKKDALREIEHFFRHIKEKTPREVKKIKRLAMKYNIKLGNKKRLFCKKCLHPYIAPSIRIKNGYVHIGCEFCNHVAKWKLHMKDLDEEIIPLEKSEPECSC